MKVFRASAAPLNPADARTFSGVAHMKRLAEDDTGALVGVYRVVFGDGARTNWHRHTGPQWLFVIEGRIRAQVWDGPSQDVDAGDAIVFAPGEKHWHGAVPGASGTHLAVNVNATTEWLEVVSDEEYYR